MSLQCRHKIVLDSFFLPRQVVPWLALLKQVLSNVDELALAWFDSNNFANQVVHSGITEPPVSISRLAGKPKADLVSQLLDVESYIRERGTFHQHKFRWVKWTDRAVQIDYPACNFRSNISNVNFHQPLTLYAWKYFTLLHCFQTQANYNTFILIYQKLYSHFLLYNFSYFIWNIICVIRTFIIYKYKETFHIRFICWKNHWVFIIN